MPIASDDIAAGIIAKWSAAFAKLDPDALSSLYSRHALFYGSNPTLYRGRDGVRSYFAALPGWNSQSVRFTNVATSAAGGDVVNMAGTANFSVDDAALAVKITWVIVREDGDWKIVSHHVSSKAPLIDQVT
ncbi:MAG: nuclear transport factor 2 family protein [Bradyrhizobium sp.]